MNFSDSADVLRQVRYMPAVALQIVNPHSCFVLSSAVDISRKRPGLNSLRCCTNEVFASKPTSDLSKTEKEKINKDMET